MNEVTKTAVFVVVAACLFGGTVLLHLTNQSQLDSQQPEDMIGKPLFEEFDALDVASLEIVKYDEETGKGIPFEVARVDGIWSIPSHNNYPADAKDQVTEAATSMMGLEVLSVASDNPADHELYGVVDPDPKTLKPGAVGVGTRVVMKSKDQKSLVAMVIGKEVEGTRGQHYVSRIGQTAVYTVAVNPGKLSTKFEDWIEDDLLSINAWDIQQVQIRDYTVADDGVPNLRDVIVLDHNDTEDPKWKMVRNQAFVGDELKEVEMTEKEELDTDNLDKMVGSLDDLKIVDVRRKPAGLSANLKAAGSFAGDTETQLSLVSKGFFMSPREGGFELLSQNGDVRYVMKDGVEYVLRFGGIAHGTATEKSEEEAKEGSDEEGKEQSKEEPGENRYIFVMAQFNPDAVAKPVKEALPEQKPAEEKPAEDEAPDSEAAEDAGTAQSDATEAEEASDSASEEASGEAADATADEVAADESTETDAAEDAEKPAEETAEKPVEETAEKSAAEEDPIAAERERIETQYRRDMDEYEEKIAKGRKRVDELNARFADWYYVISNKVYEKIHLGRDKIVKKKDAGEDAAKTDGQDHGPGDGHNHGEESSLETFNRLRESGLGDQ